MNDLFNLKNKRILVVGSSSDIGLDVCVSVANLGGFAVLIDTDTTPLNDRVLNEENIVMYSYDIYNQSLIESFVNNLCKDLGRFDGLVYCGAACGIVPLSMTKYPLLERMMICNTFSFIEYVRVITKRKNFNNGGSILAISSISSIKGFKSKTAYSSSKAALDAAVRCAANELSDRKIRVNSILKGWMDADVKEVDSKYEMVTQNKEDLNKQVLGIIKSKEMANLISFLLSDNINTITGQSIIVDGGYSLQ